MGVDLRLLPFDAPFFSHTVLGCERRRELWPKVSALESAPLAMVAKEFSCFVSRRHPSGEMGYGQIDAEDPYGTPFRCTTARELSKLWSEPEVRDNEKNRAIWDYLAALDPETHVVLYWH